MGEWVLKVVTQGELLFPRLHQLMTVDTESLAAGDGDIKSAQRANRAGVEAGRVGHIKDLPGKAQGLSFKRFPSLGQSAILFEVTIAAERIALAVFTRIRIPQRITIGYPVIERIGIGKDLGQSLRIDVPVYLDRPGDHGEAYVLVVGRIGVWRSYAKRQPTRQARNPRQRPSADQSIGQAIGTSGKTFALAKWQLIDKVSGKQMACIEVGDGATQAGIEAVGDKAEAIGGEFAGTLGVGTLVDGVAICIAEVESQANVGDSAQSKLKGVVAAHADRRPCKQRRKLALIKSGHHIPVSVDIRPATQAALTWQAKCVQYGQCK
jgi:hypothetical protein